MAAPGSSTPGKKDRREEAREKARIEREAEKKRQRRNKIFLQGGIGVAVIAIVVVIVLIVVNGGGGAPTKGPGPKNMASNGILLVGPDMKAQTTPAAKASGKAVVTDRAAHKTTANIVTYIDYQCPYCQQFETTNEAQIKTMVDSGKATLEIHPISFLDNASLGNKYSTRAANAAACVANYDPNDFYAVNTALFANQPAEQTNGKTDAQLLSVLNGAGADSKAIESCVTSKKFVPWVTNSSAALHIGSQTKVFQGVANTPAVFGGTPTVFVNGEQYKGSLTDPSDFAAFVSANS